MCVCVLYVLDGLALPLPGVFSRPGTTVWASLSIWGITTWLILQLQSATKLRRNRFQRAYTDAASETLNPAASASSTATTSILQLPAITVRLPY